MLYVHVNIGAVIQCKAGDLAPVTRPNPIVVNFRRILVGRNVEIRSEVSLGKNTCKGYKTIIKLLFSIQYYKCFRIKTSPACICRVTSPISVPLLRTNENVRFVWDLQHTYKVTYGKRTVYERADVKLLVRMRDIIQTVWEAGLL